MFEAVEQPGWGRRKPKSGVPRSAIPRFGDSGIPRFGDSANPQFGVRRGDRKPREAGLDEPIGLAEPIETDRPVEMNAEENRNPDSNQASPTGSSPPGDGTPELEAGDLRPDQLRALVERAQKGDRQAFTVLLERHRGVAIAKAYGTLGDMDLSYDALQDAFLKTWQKLSTLGQPERFSGWFLMIVKNASLDVARRRSRVSVREQGWEELPGDDRSLPRPTQGAESLARGERTQRIRDAIQSLPPEYREVLLLKHEEGRSYREIARLLRTTVKAVESRLFRARQQLSRAIENEGRSEGESRR